MIALRDDGRHFDVALRITVHLPGRLQAFQIGVHH